MGTIQPRARGGASIGASLDARKRREEQLGRQRVDLPKPVPPVVTGGGVVGMAEIRSTAGSVTWAAGQTKMAYTGVTYDAPTDPNAGGGGASSPSWATVSGHQIIVTPGWYIPVLTLAAIWTNGGAPAAFGGPYTNGGWDSVHNNYPIVPLAPMGSGLAGFVQVANFGPTYVQAGGDLHAELRAIGGAATGDCDPVQSYAVWNITKLG